MIRLREPSGFAQDDARLAALHGYVGVDTLKRDLAIIQLLGQLEAKLDRLIAGLTARGSL